MLPPFITGGGQSVPNFWPKSRSQSSSDRRIFEPGRFIRKQKQTSRIDDRSTTIPNLGWVGPPTPRTVGTMGTPKGKRGKFLILHSSGSGRVQRHQCYTTCWGCTCCKKATVPYLPVRPLQFTGGSPKRVKVENFLYILYSSGPRRVHRHQCYTAYWAVADVKRLSCHIPQFAPYISQGAKFSNPH